VRTQVASGPGRTRDEPARVTFESNAALEVRIRTSRAFDAASNPLVIARLRHNLERVALTCVAEMRRVDIPVTIDDLSMMMAGEV
jgi:hypothetical protein